ncbi:MAG: leucine-rich repeat domain-containing protein [Paludibacteraceae bacterium]|nr:leucine-rich repeat domain-containing protein [Paludibacteraceae bacterium]
MKTRIFTSIMSLFIATMAFAYKTEIDGIYYDFDHENKTAEVVSEYGNYYSGDIIIPEKVNYGVEYSVTSIGYEAFYDCSSLTSITIPNSVTSIGDYAFQGCSSLTSITIPNSVTSIGDYAFQGCSSLTSVQWNAKKYSDFDYRSPFDGCEQITSFTFGDNVEYIPAYLCRGMSKLTSITIPNSVTSIGDRAFSGCPSLTSITIPNSVTTIGGDAFFECYSLVDVYIFDVGAWFDIEFKNCSTANPLHYAENLYLNNKKVTDVVVPEDVDSIKDYVFYNYSALTSITIPNSVTFIGKSAFRGCSGLTSIEIPNIVTSIGERAFYGCYSLDTLICEFGDDVEFYVEYDHPFATTKNFRYFQGPAKLVNTISEEVQTQFSNKLTEVHITDGELDENGFNYINRSKKSLHTIDLAGTTNTAINDLAFYDCYKLENLMLPGNLETIGFKAMAECYQLKEINIPASVVEINDAAFENCRSIKSITFGGQAEAKSFASRMKRAAADGDVALQRIGNWAFYNCHALENLVIPEGVTEVGDAAFYGCTYLDSLALPSTTQRIGDNCFALCSRMKQINVNAIEPPTIFAKTFFDVNRNIPVIVPEGAREAYANDEYWGEFINVVESENEETQIENAENANVAIYSVGGVLYVDGLSADYQLFDVNGRLIYTGRDAQLSLPRGVYVIAVGGEVEKIVL